VREKWPSIMQRGHLLVQGDYSWATYYEGRGPRFVLVVAHFGFMAYEM
jgi:hypothetical protein